MKNKCYSELKRLKTFEERFDYLSIGGEVGRSTFGFDRWLNQKFYRSREWRDVRDVVIFRDDGCDLGIEGYPIVHDLLIHHINPVMPKDLEDRAEWILDPEFLITTSRVTHNAIHFGDSGLLVKPYVPRSSGDTRLW